MSQKCNFFFSSVPKGNLRPVCRNQWTCFKHNIYHDLKQTIIDLDLDSFTFYLALFLSTSESEII